MTPDPSRTFAISLAKKVSTSSRSLDPFLTAQLKEALLRGRDSRS